MGGVYGLNACIHALLGCFMPLWCKHCAVWLICSSHNVTATISQCTFCFVALHH